MKRILFHICCAPCFTAPYKQMLRENEYEISGYWFNDNIHPYKEYEKRLDTLTEWSRRESVPLITENAYGLKEFINRVAGRETERCYFCYYFRLLKTALKAKELHYDMFSTSLLYSVYQKHDLIRHIAGQIADVHQVGFYYRDFRELWQEGIRLSKEKEMYRQNYCGCIFSEEERWLKKT